MTIFCLPDYRKKGVGMAQNIAHYIEKERQRGFLDSEIEKALLKAGYSQAAVARAFDALDREFSVREHLPEHPMPYRPRSVKTFLAVMMLIMVFVFLALYMDANNGGEETAETHKKTRAPRLLSAAEESELIDGLFYKCLTGLLQSADRTCLALAAGDPSLCVDRNCTDMYFLLSSLSQGNGCEKIQSARLQEYCGITESCHTDDAFAGEVCRALIQMNPGVCSSAECTDAYYLVAAVKTGQADLCNNATGETRQECLAFLRKDPGECVNRDYCRSAALSDVAYIKGDSLLCEKIAEPMHKERCRQAVLN